MVALIFQLWLRSVQGVDIPKDKMGYIYRERNTMRTHCVFEGFKVKKDLLTLTKLSDSFFLTLTSFSDS